MLVLPSDLTYRQASACLRMLVQGLKVLKGPEVVVDASALTVFDTSALAVLLECRREALVDRKAFVSRACLQLWWAWPACMVWMPCSRRPTDFCGDPQ